MDPTHAASNSTQTSSTHNSGSSLSDLLGSNLSTRINSAVNNLARAMHGVERIPDNVQFASQTRNRKLQACSDTVAKAIEVLIGSDTAASPHSMLLSPVEINSTVKAFAGYLGHGLALSRLHLAMEQPNGSYEIPSLAELQNTLASLGNNSPERAQDIARASLGELVKNIPEGMANVPLSDPSPSQVEFVRNHGPSALLLLAALNENSAEADVVSTRTDLNIDQLTLLSQTLAVFVDTQPIDTPQHEVVLKFAQHIAGKVSELSILSMFNPTRLVPAAQPYLGRCTDMDVMKALVQNNGPSLRFASQELKNNLDLVMIAVQQHGKALRFASPELQDNLDVVMAAVQQHPMSFEYASPSLRDNLDVVMVAVQRSGWALRFVSPALRNNPGVVMAAVQQNGWVIELASPALRNNPDIAIAAIRQNALVFEFADPDLRNNPDVIAAYRQLGTIRR